MNSAQTIIEKLKEKGMSYAAIGSAIGSSRESVSRIAHGQQSGERSLAQLQKLAAVAGISTIKRYVPSNEPQKPRKPDISPLTQEQLAEQDEQDKYDEWEPFTPVAKTIGQAVSGVRAKIADHLLPDNYSIVKAYKVPGQARIVVESGPRPHRPRKRKKRRTTTTTYHSPQWNLGTLIIAVVSTILAPDTQQSQQYPSPYQNNQRLLPAAYNQANVSTSIESPRYQPTYQFPPHGIPDNQYVTLAWPRNNAPHINRLGYTSQDVGEPVQPKIQFGRIPKPSN